MRVNIINMIFKKKYFNSLIQEDSIVFNYIYFMSDVDHIGVHFHLQFRKWTFVPVKCVL